MNGFEPLRRRIIDYTEAGQWSEVYDGPIEDCESEKLKADNAKLLKERDKYYDLYVHAITDAEVWHLQWSAEYQENAKLRELLQRTWDAFHDATASDFVMVKNELRELGVEVDR